MSENGLITVASKFSVGETLDRLTTAITAAGLHVFARIDHAQGAASVGIATGMTKLLSSIQ